MSLLHRSNRTSFTGAIIVPYGTKGAIQACFPSNNNATKDQAFWKSQDTLVDSLPFFPIQLGIVIFVIRVLFSGLKLVGQARFSAEIIGAIMLGPSGFGEHEWFATYVHPLKSAVVLETIGNLGLVYDTFLAGLEMEPTTVKRIGKKALCNGLIGILMPLVVGAGAYFLLARERDIKKSAYDAVKQDFGAVYWGIALTVTSFPDLSRVLSDIKLLHTDIGRLALSSALVTDLASWTLLIGAITFENRTNYYIFLVSTLVFVLFCWFVVRPALSRTIGNALSASNGSKHTDLLIFLVLSGVILWGFITDACGSYSLIGAFMFGLVIPRGELGMRIIEKCEDFVTGILIPAFLLITGLRTNRADFIHGTKPYILLGVIALACSAKIVNAFIVSMIYGMSTREGVPLRVLMNTKGYLALIILNVGRNIQALDNQSFVVMMPAFLVMMAAVKPIPSWTYKSRKHFRHYKRRTMERIESDSELRILVCINASHNLTGKINLLEFSNSTKKSPICIFAVHLVDLKGRLSAMLIVHDTSTSIGKNPNVESMESNHIISAFESFESRGQAVSVQSLTAVSPYATMHEDICNLAEDKRVTLILVPFHKQASIDGVLQQEDSAIRVVNQNLIARAPCSVGIFIDRGLGFRVCQESNHYDDRTQQQQRRSAMIFTGGPDDREALAYACRMARSPDVNLTVVRFVPGREATDMMAGNGPDDAGKGILTSIMEMEKQGKLDDEYYNKFRFRTMCDESITLVEKMVNSGVEMITTIRTMFDDYDMYIVGRGKGVASPLTLGLSDWTESEELGLLGDALSTFEFAQYASILVIQQYYAPDAHINGTKTTHASHH